MTIVNIFEWIQDAAQGGLDILNILATGVGDLFYITGTGGEIELTALGVLVVAGVGAPLAWKFIKYIVSLFSKVKPN